METTTTVQVNENFASRWKRLGASLIDSLIMVAVMLPLMFFTGGFDGFETGRASSTAYNIGLSLISIVVFMGINWKFLMQDGQTIGKKALDIKIVDMEENVPDQISILKRYGLYFGLGQIPMAGPFLSIINILFIFGKERRCGHDYFAKTKVINVDA